MSPGQMEMSGTTMQRLLNFCWRWQSELHPRSIVQARLDLLMSRGQEEAILLLRGEGGWELSYIHAV